VAAPTLITATPPIILAKRFCSFHDHNRSGFVDLRTHLFLRALRSQPSQRRQQGSCCLYQQRYVWRDRIIQGQVLGFTPSSSSNHPPASQNGDIFEHGFPAITEA
jgi:hypothetical protein